MKLILRPPMHILIIKNAILFVLAWACVFGFSYWYPRFLVAHLGEDSPWTSYFYTYGMGFVFFLLSLIWIFTRKKADPIRRRQDMSWLIVISCGFFFMFSLHALWIFLAVHFPVQN